MKKKNRSMKINAVNGGCGRFSRRIGSTTYLVTVRFSEKSRETFEDKILRLIEKEARKTA